jgi:membrane protein YqaA with SNARE-associated domain
LEIAMPPSLQSFALADTHRRVERKSVSETSPAVVSPATPAPSRNLFGLLRRMYDWTLAWAETKWGPTALGVLAFTESSFFPIPPDPLLMALSLGKPKRAFHFALLCTVASVLGGVFGYYIGLYLWEAVHPFFFQYVPGFTQKNFAFVEAKYQQNAFLAIFAAAFTPIPYKVFTVASGVFHTGLAVLVSASALGRGMRFFMVAGLLRWIGEPAKHFIDRYFNLLTIGFFILLALGFWVVKYFL